MTLLLIARYVFGMEERRNKLIEFGRLNDGAAVFIYQKSQYMEFEVRKAEGNMQRAHTPYFVVQCLEAGNEIDSCPPHNPVGTNGFSVPLRFLNEFRCVRLSLTSLLV